MLSFNYGFTYFQDKVVLTAINQCVLQGLRINLRYVHHAFISQKPKKLKEKKNLPFGQLSITVVSTPSYSMIRTQKFLMFKIFLDL